MFTSKFARRWSPAVGVLVVVVGVGSLSACRSGQQTVDVPDRPSGPSTSELRTDLRGLSADRIEEILVHEAALSRELTGRFAGVPADRIEERLDREAQP